FGIQEGDTYDWGTITDSLVLGPVDTRLPLSVPGLIITGAVIFAVLLLWQAVNPREPLVPLSLFRDRNFSVAPAAIALMGARVLAFAIPPALFFQQVLGMSPTRAALMTAPSAMLSLGLAPFVGRWMVVHDPRWLVLGGFAALAAGLGA